MNAALIEALNRAPSLELFHLSTIIERLMSDPARIIEIRRHLHLGQSVRFLDWQQAGAQMSMRAGRIVAMRDTQLTVQDERTRREWKLPYAAIEMPDSGPVPASSAPEPLRPTRADFQVGDRASFEDRHLQTRVGTIVRINQRTATLDCDGPKLARLLRTAAAYRRSLSSAASDGDCRPDTSMARPGAMLGVGLAGAIITPVSGMLVAWLFGMFAGLGKENMDVLFLFGALPPAVSCFIFADRYNQGPDKVAAIVMIGNAAALFFIPLALALRL